jgi:hypothetical protein
MPHMTLRINWRQMRSTINVYPMGFFSKPLPTNALWDYTAKSTTMSGFFPQKQEINTSKCTGIFHRAFVLLKLNPNIESKGKHSQKYFLFSKFLWPQLSCWHKSYSNKATFLLGYRNKNIRSSSPTSWCLRKIYISQITM